MTLRLPSNISTDIYLEVLDQGNNYITEWGNREVTRGRHQVARGKVTHTFCAEDQIWTGRYEGIDERLPNSNVAVDTDEKQLQREGSRRLGEGALGGTPPPEKLRNRYETGDRQRPTDFSFPRMVICFDSFILSTAFPNPSVANNTPQILTDL